MPPARRIWGNYEKNFLKISWQNFLSKNALKLKIGHIFNSIILLYTKYISVYFQIDFWAGAHYHECEREGDSSDVQIWHFIPRVCAAGIVCKIISVYKVFLAYSYNFSVCHECNVLCWAKNFLRARTGVKCNVCVVLRCSADPRPPADSG